MSRPTTGSPRPAAEQARPGHERPGPQPARVGLDRQVEEPHERRLEQHEPGPARQEPHLRVRVGHVVRPEAPSETRPEREEQERDAEGAPPVAATEDDVPPGHEAGRAHQQDGEAQERELLRELVLGPGVGVHPLGLRPRRDHLEPHRPAAVRRGLDPDRQVLPLGPRPLPRRPRVGVEERRPPRAHRAERVEVEPRLAEEPLPVRRRTGTPAGRSRAAGDRVEAQQPPAHVVRDAGHVGDVDARLRPVHAAAGQPGDDRPRALAVPELQHGRRPLRERLPAPDGRVLFANVEDEARSPGRGPRRRRPGRPSSRRRGGTPAPGPRARPAASRSGAAAGAGTSGPGRARPRGPPARRPGGPTRRRDAGPPAHPPPPRARATASPPPRSRPRAGRCRSASRRRRARRPARRRGSFSRQARIARSTAGSRPATRAEGSMGRSSR